MSGVRATLATRDCILSTVCERLPPLPGSRPRPHLSSPGLSYRATYCPLENNAAFNVRFSLSSRHKCIKTIVLNKAPNIFLLHSEYEEIHQATAPFFHNSLYFQIIIICKLIFILHKHCNEVVVAIRNSNSKGSTTNAKDVTAFIKERYYRIDANKIRK